MEFEKFEVSKTDIEKGEVEWPVHCRNCQNIYPREIKTGVSRLIFENVDFLKAVTTSFLDIGITRYCCINNYRPRVVHVESGKLVAEYFVEIRARVYVDRTMTDWMDIRWEDDEDGVDKEDISDISNNPLVADNSISLFDL